ncbi:hypothetical protein DL93DRAFT_2032805, partial [Clavulina sp. PMI_390]
FTLHVYALSIHGDMAAMKHCMCMKGYNGIRPCRYCKIRAIQSPLNRHYYPALHEPASAAESGKSWDPLSLPLRSEEEIEDVLQALEDDSYGIGARNELKVRTGLNGRSALTEIPGISLTCSFPLEWFHLFLKNVAELFLSLWKGKFSGLPEIGEGEFRIPDAVWETIGADTVAAAATIPSSFGRATPNIATEQHNFAAEDMGFWFVYLGPYLLKGRFPQDKYYDHYMLFVKILRLTLQTTITQAEVNELRTMVAECVKQYE